VSTNSRIVKASADQVWRVLSDGWLYPVFVVGATRMRNVDEQWPEVGAELHHSVGVWPLVLDDTTSVLESQPPTMLKLRARARPGGEAEVTFRLRPRGPETEVTIEEDAVAGPSRLVPKPVRDLPLGWRNVETLRRLAFIAESRSG
jgi:hypothetical protein